MPPRRSRSREREPSSGPSPPEGPSNLQSPASSARDRSVSFHSQASGEFTLLQKPEDLVSNTNVSCGASTTAGTNGQPSRSAITPKTLLGPPEERSSKGVTSSSSILTSPNYFDMHTVRRGAQLRDGPSSRRQDPIRKEDGTVHGQATGINPHAHVDGGRPSWGRPSATREDSCRYQDDTIRNNSSKKRDAHHSRAGGEPSAPSTDEAKEFAAANAMDRDLGFCPIPGCYIRPRRFSLGA